MTDKAKQIRKVVIAGGGTAGWMAAAALSRKLGELLDITLVESDAIGTVGVGESTIPPICSFHRILGIDEQEFMRATQATFKLGISFENWARDGDRYLHSFGINGQSSWMAEFHHFWLSGLERGIKTEFGDHTFEHKAAREGKFGFTSGSKVNYAYHLDATLYAKYLRAFSERYGAKRVEGKITAVKQNDDGFISSLTLDNGQTIEGDLFIDCTGFRALLIEDTLKTGYEDWSHWLPCDSAAVVQTESIGPAMPYTRAIAHGAGWRWRIPIQTRMGNGLVYCSRYLDDDSAKQRFVESLEGSLVGEPRIIKFRTGRRAKAWNKNCIALGLSSGFLEPLESTSIHLIAIGVTRLLQLFPFDGIKQTVADRFNGLANDDLENIRDFLILHYHATEREDTDFWRYCKNMAVPDTLKERMRLFKESGYLFHTDGELFRMDSWVQVMLGQRVTPESYHPLARLMKDHELKQFLGGLKASVDKQVNALPSHQEFVERYCMASKG